MDLPSILEAGDEDFSFRSTPSGRKRSRNFGFTRSSQHGDGAGVHARIGFKGRKAKIELNRITSLSLRYTSAELDKRID